MSNVGKQVKRAAALVIVIGALGACKSGTDAETRTNEWITDTPPVYTVRLKTAGTGASAAEDINAEDTSRAETEAGGGKREPETAGAVIRAEAGGEVRLGEAGIVIPGGALEEDTEIRITRLWEVAETGEGIANATEGGGGYRFEPAGTEFKKEVRIELPYEGKLTGKEASLEELQTYYYDVEGKEWVSLKKVGYDGERRVVESVTTHFTDMINGTLSLPESASPVDVNLNSIKNLEAADPGAGVGGLEGLTGGRSDGSAGFSLGIAAPGGRGGMSGGAAITYNSNGGSGISGKGFDVQYGSTIGVDTRRGAVRYDGSEVYALDGVQLEEVETTGERPRRVTVYTPKNKGSFSKIEHYESGNYWEVTGTNGGKGIYGKSAASWGGADSSGVKKNVWNLEKQIDINGNTVKYEYYEKDGDNYAYIKKIVWPAYSRVDVKSRLRLTVILFRFQFIA
ncbi:hypothetical protein FACS1894124_7550 [Spirochaetia bacterium]|nr:hypothetical protein FACS1894124_7550 [Spirochaetia bacterium]